MASSLTGTHRGFLFLLVTLAAFPGSRLAADAAVASAQGALPTADLRPEHAFSLGTLQLFAEDTVNVFTAPARWDGVEWLAAAGASSAALGSTAFDISIRNSVQKHRTPAEDRFARSFQHFGADYSFVILAGFEAFHFLGDDRRSQAVFIDGLAASLIASGFIAPILKYSVGRVRPSDTSNPYQFRPFTNHNSFPSGHTTQAFAVATVIASHYRSWWVQILAYGSAGLVGCCRIEQNAHFTSDVVAGSLIGWFVARSVVKHNDGKTQAPHFTLLPYSDGRANGLMLTKNF